MPIFDVGSWRSITRAATCGIRGPRHHERVPVALVEPLGQVPGQLHVLRLVVANRHARSPAYARMSAAISAGYVSSDSRTLCPAASARADFSLYWIIRRISPSVATHSSRNDSRACSSTWLCANTVHTAGSSPEASSRLAACRLNRRTRAGSWSTVSACRSTTQKSDVAAVLAFLGPVPERAEVVPQGEVPGGLDAAEDARPVLRASHAHRCVFSVCPLMPWV